MSGFKLLWGASAIGVFIDRPTREVFYMLKRGMIPAQKVGNQWVATEDNLVAFLSGKPAAFTKEADHAEAS